MNRRDLAKGIAAGWTTAHTATAHAALPRLSENSEAPATHDVPITWQRIHPGIWRGTLGTPEPHTPVRLRLIPPQSSLLDAMPASAAPPLENAVGRVDARGCHLSLALDGDEAIYGFGLQLQSLNHRTRKRILRVNADPKGDSGDSHAPVPFYVTTRGYGLLIDTLRYASVYCGEIYPKPVRSAAADAAAVNTPEETRRRQTEQTSRVLVEIPIAQGADIYLFAGPTMLDAVRRYNLFSGGGVAPPEWGLGFWYRAEMHLDQSAVLALGKTLHDREIPCDVLGLEPGWQTHAYSCSFVWNPQRFPRPTQFLRDAAALGFKVNLWEHAFTHPTSPLFASLAPHAGDTAVWEGLVPDFAGQPARDLFGDYHGRELIDAGVSGFKLDECDNSDYTGGWSFPEMSRFPSGLDGEQMHSLFGLRYQHALLAQFQQRRQPTYSLVRSSGALAAPYPFALYSDLYDHRQFVRGLVNSGFSGLLWCPEIRDAISEEDLLRRLQTGVFSALAMVNAWYIRNPPWQQMDRDRNNRDELAPDWQSLEARCREILGWRMQLVPYLRAAFARYALDGTPPFRALCLDDPADQTLREIDDQFLVGDSLMVAPLFAGEPGRDIVFTAGDWFDLWTKKRIDSSKPMHIDRAYGPIPAFVRSGAVLPFAAVTNTTHDPGSRNLTVHVFGAGDRPFRIASAAWPEIELSWNSATAAGHVEQPRDASRPYHVVAWQHHIA